MDYAKLAELLFPHITKVPADYETMYPQRDLPDGAYVTRVAPSPTGHIHLGTLYQALLDERLAHLNNGVFFLRIEDTDSKREVKGAAALLIEGLRRFGVTIDEGAVEGGDLGNYGPYRQSQRAEIYQTIAKELVRQGLAYPCFCTEEELKEIHDKQAAENANFGYFGKWAVCRDLSLEEIQRRIDAKMPFVLRFRSNGTEGGRIRHRDFVRGEIELPENFNDVILLKSDGIPTYHFAHVVDDHFMHTTCVVRGEEWLSTFHWHIQMWQALGWKMPDFVHTAHMLKLDNGSKRKLSKRHDPEASLSYYVEAGYPAQGVIEYLMTILNSNYEEWRLKNPDADYRTFPLSPKHMSQSGALFDLDKLHDICKTLISRMTAEEVYEPVVAWAREFAPDFCALLEKDPDYAKRILAIGRGGAKPRKDLTVWKDVPAYMDFFYDELFAPFYEFPENMPKEDVIRVLEQYPAVYDPADEQSVWFDKVKALTAELGYSPDMKAYKKNPDAFPGHVGDISMVLRVAITGKTSSPDTYAVMQLLGKDRVCERLNRALAALKA